VILNFEGGTCLAADFRIRSDLEIRFSRDSGHVILRGFSEE